MAQLFSLSHSFTVHSSHARVPCSIGLEKGRGLFFENSCLVFLSVVPFSCLKETLFARSCFHSSHARVPRSISLEEGRGGEHRQLTSLPITLLPPSRPLAKTKANTNTNTYKFKYTQLTWLPNTVFPPSRPLAS